MCIKDRERERERVKETEKGREREIKREREVKVKRLSKIKRERGRERREKWKEGDIEKRKENRMSTLILFFLIELKQNKCNYLTFYCQRFDQI